jgi:hypothetical protein
MFYVYLEAESDRALLTTAVDFLSAQFFAAKFSENRPGTVAVYAAATGQPRDPLMIFEKGLRREGVGPLARPIVGCPPPTDAGG